MSSANPNWVAPSPKDLQAEIPAYQITKKLGEGGMGAVYEARQEKLDRLVAIKILPPIEDEENDAIQFAERFRNEAKAMAALKHPAIVNVFDYGRTPSGLRYFVMEHIDGSDVYEMIGASGGRLDPEQAHAICAHVCDALQYAHDHGLIHRDIKPANIMVDHEGFVKVADFGLAKSLVNDPGLTIPDLSMGTPDFAAPEAMEAGVELDGRADLYSLGVSLYQMLTGQVPRGAWEPPSKLVPGLNPRFDAIVAKAMAPDRESRYPSAREMRADLDAAVKAPIPKPDDSNPQTAAMRRVPATAKPVSTAAESSQGTQPPKKSSSKKPILIMTAITATLAALAVGAFVVSSGIRQNSDEDDSNPNPPANDGSLATSATTEPEPTSDSPVEVVEASETNPTPEPQPAPEPVLVAQATPPTQPDQPEPAPAAAGDGGGDSDAEWTMPNVTFPLPPPRRPKIGGELVTFEVVEDAPQDDNLLPAPTGLKNVVGLSINRQTLPIRYGLALLDTGEVVSWGQNAGGQADVPGDLRRDVAQVAAGVNNGAVLYEDGTIRTWGDIAPAVGDVKDAVAIVFAGRRLAILLATGDVLVRPENADEWSPPAELNRVTAINGDFSAMAAIRNDGSVKLWGQQDADYLKLPEGAEPAIDVAMRGGRVLITADGRSLLWGRLLTYTNPVYNNWPWKSRPVRGRHSAPTESKSIDSFRIVQTEDAEWHFFPRELDVDRLADASANCVELQPWGAGCVGIRVPEAQLQLAMQEREQLRWHQRPLVTDPEGGTAPAVVAQNPNPNPPAPAGTPASKPEMPDDPVSKQLAELEAKFREAYDEKAGGPHSEAVGKLNRQFLGALKREETAASRAGDLDTVLLYQNEAKRIAAGWKPAAEPDPEEGAPEKLLGLRKTYLTQIARLEAKRDADAKPIVEAYDAALEAYQVELTKAQNIAGAVRVKEAREKIASGAAAEEAAKPKTAEGGAKPVGKLPGRVRAKGQLSHHRTMEPIEVDLSLLEDTDDVIDVVANVAGCAVLRANGEAIAWTPSIGEGIWRTDGVVRIEELPWTGFLAFKADGTIECLGGGGLLVNPLNANPNALDAAAMTDKAAAILRAGGKLEFLVQDPAQWPELDTSKLPALREVVGSGRSLGFVTEDNRLLLYDHNGLDEALAEPESGEVDRVWGTYSSIFALTNDGNLIHYYHDPNNQWVRREVDRSLSPELDIRSGGFLTLMAQPGRRWWAIEFGERLENFESWAELRKVQPDYAAGATARTVDENGKVVDRYFFIWVEPAE